MLYWFSTSPWPGLILWIVLYISDYYLTLYAARGFKEIGHIQFEGSYELTPQYQKDIDALTPVSRRHLIALVLSSAILSDPPYLKRLSLKEGKQIDFIGFGLVICHSPPAFFPNSTLCPLPVTDTVVSLS